MKALEKRAPLSRTSRQGGAGKKSTQVSRRPPKPEGDGSGPVASQPERTLGKPVGAVIAAVAVFHALHQSQRPLTASEVARATGLYRGTAFNILRTLQREGIVTFDERDFTYLLGTQMLEFAHGVLRTSGLLDVVRPEMFSFAEKCGVTVFLAKLTSNKDLVILDFVGGAFRVDTYSSVGRRSPRFSGAPGVVIAAFSGVSLDHVEQQFAQTEWFRRPTFDDYVRRVEETRKNGFAIDKGDRRHGLTQVAAPIFSQSGELALVVTAVDFSYTMTPAKIKDVAKGALAFCNRVSLELSRLRLA
jgi:DNA-binding IclR family transcriptional regulator